MEGTGCIWLWGRQGFGHDGSPQGPGISGQRSDADGGHGTSMATSGLCIWSIPACCPEAAQAQEEPRMSLRGTPEGAGRSSARVVRGKRKCSPPAPPAPASLPHDKPSPSSETQSQRGGAPWGLRVTGGRAGGCWYREPFPEITGRRRTQPTSTTMLASPPPSGSLLRISTLCRCLSCVPTTLGPALEDGDCLGLNSGSATSLLCVLGKCLKLSASVN